MHLWTVCWRWATFPICPLSASVFNFWISLFTSSNSPPMVTARRWKSKQAWTNTFNFFIFLRRCTIELRQSSIRHEFLYPSKRQRMRSERNNLACALTAFIDVGIWKRNRWLQSHFYFREEGISFSRFLSYRSISYFPEAMIQFKLFRKSPHGSGSSLFGA